MLEWLADQFRLKGAGHHLLHQALDRALPEQLLRHKRALTQAQAVRAAPFSRRYELALDLAFP